MTLTDADSCGVADADSDAVTVGLGSGAGLSVTVLFEAQVPSTKVPAASADRAQRTRDRVMSRPSPCASGADAPTFFLGLQ
ncbi:hypothetical protein BSZ39_10940 [Bowdeniella nasicola]|uniref:Uncharacterized protein n=1 Tax=Bowdeniella nasicola TaxID=208480 RepID=A0A1Q5Q072_9ACTO|nr:hypothetical protein BSZ39_10940 [Bowdeniella nasicola]